MIDDVGKPPTDGTGLMARRLTGETGITEGQARELVSILGPFNWSSLLREARMLNPHRKPFEVGKP